MKTFTIQNHLNKNILFSGRYRSFKDCLEDAHTQRVSLEFADLRNQNLINAQLDEANLPSALFTGSNLTGANLSEGSFQKSDFSGCDLYNTCFAYSDLKNCNFEFASFGATDITGCTISYAHFASLSCFSLNFSHVLEMHSCVYTSSQGYQSLMSKPPIVITGLSPSPVVMLDEVIYYGDHLMKQSNFIGLLNLRSIAHK